MSAKTYIVFNCANPTTAAPVKQPTGTAIRTMMQITPGVPIRIIEFGCSFDGSSAATPGIVEVVDTGVIPASGANYTAYLQADIQPVNDPFAPLQTKGLAFPGTPLTAVTATTATVTATPLTVDTTPGAVLIAGTSIMWAQSNTTSVVTGNGGWIGGNPGGTVAYTLTSGYPLLIQNSLSGFMTGAPTEGTITATRPVIAPQLVAPTNQFLVQNPLGREGECSIGRTIRVRATFGTTVNMIAYLIFEV